VSTGNLSNFEQSLNFGGLHLSTLSTIQNLVYNTSQRAKAGGNGK
jgi:hypothetical protein